MINEATWLRPNLLPSPSQQQLLHNLVTELKQVIEGDVRFDEVSRSLYATDASPYEIKPYGVVIPKSVADISHTLKLAKQYHLPILMRGGGTSLAGQTVGEAIIIDVSKYLTNILEFNAEEAWVKVEPGVVRDQLNAFLKPYKLQFTPDVSPTNRANVGGMVANNSAGTRSIKYGKTVDQVISMRVMLTDGSMVEFKALDEKALKAKQNQQDLEGEIYRKVDALIHEHEADIRAIFPKVLRRVGGYNLDEFINNQPFNLAKLISGSEGTLAMILDVTLRLYPIPTKQCLVMLHFAKLVDALKATQYINRHQPSAVEIFDAELFRLGLANPSLKPLLGWLNGTPEAVLMVEFDGETEAEMLKGLKSLETDVEVAALSYHAHIAYEAKEQAEILDFRRKGLGIYATIKGDEKPTPFVEDAAIPVENLPYYIPEMLALCQRLGVRAVLYGHASVGVLHLRPLLDLKTDKGIRLYQRISEESFKLVKKYGGSWSGEHGDGLIRSYQNKNLFGDKLYGAFCELKAVFDPENLMNPGKIVHAAPMTENLRYGESYQAPFAPAKTYFDFSQEEGFLGAVELCTGVGACRKVGTGVMCPSYMATREEEHSTRGRANILREAMTGRLPGGLTSQEVYDALDLCLECKACKSECESQVDMAKVKYEFLQQYYDVHGVGWGARAVANTARIAPLGSLLAPIANALLPLKSIRLLIETLTQVDKRRILPSYTAESFAKWFKKQPKTTQGKKVALYADTWTMYNEKAPGQAAVKVLEACGYQVELIPYTCCGRPLISKGLLKEAKVQAEQSLDRLYDYVLKDIPVVGLEPSCIASFQDDYRDLVPSEKAEAVGKHIKMIDQFLAKAWTSGEFDPKKVFHKSTTKLMLHGHCQQRAIMGTKNSMALLNWISDEVKEVDSGCCGMAGSFGYSHYDLSMQIGEQRLFPAVKTHQSKANSHTAACGFSCRHQIKDGTGYQAKHLIEILAEALKTP
ncbi:MAG: FAD-linked oxidase C-terminal domain-containing protein [Deinococcales bacterium]